jgi:tetratricopeptide (TPR) repeat protein
MKRKNAIQWFIVLVVCILTAATSVLNGEIIKLKGRALLLNRKGSPVADAKVSAVGISSTTTSNSGYFEFTLNNKKPGDLIRLKVTKKGMEVINQNKLKVLLEPGSNDVLEIIMCENGTQDIFSRIYYEISKMAINNNYELNLKKLKGDLKNNSNSTTLLKEQKNIAVALAKKLARDLIAENQEDAPELYIRAFKYFMNLKIDIALDELDDNFLARIPRRAAKCYRLKANLYMLKLDFDEAEDYFRKAMDTEPGNLDHSFDAIAFLLKQKKFDKIHLLKANVLSTIKNKYKKAFFLDTLGLLYSNTIKMKEAEKAFTDALEIRRTLAAADKNTYLPDVAETLINLGNLYTDNIRFKEAEKAYNEAFQHYRALAAADKDAYLPEVAAVQNNIGILYRQSARFNDAEKNYTESLQTYRSLAASDKTTFDSEVAKTLNNLGNLYADTGRPAHAEKVYIEALKIRKALVAASANKDVYLPLVANTLNNLGTIYAQAKYFQDAEKNLKEALQIQRSLAKNDKDTYLPDVAETLTNLGSLYYKTKRPDEAEKMHKEALEYFWTLMVNNRTAYLPGVSRSLHNLGIVYANTNRLREAETLFSDALKHLHSLDKENRGTFLPRIAELLKDMGALYYKTNRTKEAEKTFLNALSDYRTLAAADKDTYLPNVAQTLNYLAILCSETGNSRDAFANAEEVVAIREMLANKNHARFDFAYGDALIFLASLHTRFPEGSKEKARQLFDRSLSIYKKYPDIPDAVSFIKYVEKLKKDMEN